MRNLWRFLNIFLWLAVWLPPITFAQAPATSNDGKKKEETCRISGMVTKALDGAPLKGALVRLTNDEDKEHIIAAKTSSNGQFELRNVPSGRYKLIVTRNGYVQAEFGQRKPSDPGAAFSLSPGQSKTDLLFKLIPAAVISGRVFNEDGEPEPYVDVVAAKEIYEEGHKTIRRIAQANTDDLGTFRLFGLPPGKYFVSAKGGMGVVGDKEFSASSEVTGADQGYAKTYYPGTADISRASILNVKEGDEIAGTDISLKKVVVHHVRGRVLNVTPQKPASQMTSVILLSRAKRQDWEFGGEATAKADGSFEVPNVVPGAYVLLSYFFDENDRKFRFGSQKVDIADADVEGVSVLVGLGTTLSGRVIWEGQPSVDSSGLSIRASLTDILVFPGVADHVDTNQRFQLKDVPEGDNRLTIEGQSKDCYLKQITFGQKFVEDDTISVSKGANPALEITVSSRGARVQGVVINKDGLPAPGVWVVAVPEKSRRKIARLFKSQTTDQYGKFDLHGMAPGEYKFFAWDGIESNAWEDEDFLKPFEEQGTKLELKDDDSTSVNLTAILQKQSGEK